MSTETAGAEFVEYIRRNIDNKKYVLGLFFDFTAAFDSVDVRLVERKLFNMGIRGNALNLIVSFLENRHIIVNINNVNSSKYMVKLGVAQGSILGPLIFLLFVNDMPDFVNDGKIIVYADDTSVAVVRDKWDQLEAAAKSIIN